MIAPRILMCVLVVLLATGSSGLALTVLPLAHDCGGDDGLPTELVLELAISTTTNGSNNSRDLASFLRSCALVAAKITESTKNATQQEALYRPSGNATNGSSVSKDEWRAVVRFAAVVPSLPGSAAHGDLYLECQGHRRAAVVGKDGRQCRFATKKFGVQQTTCDPETVRQQLLAFSANLYGGFVDQWRPKAFAGADPCTGGYQGVSCQSTTCVVHLDLNYGTVYGGPPNISALPDTLTHFFLPNCKFDGELPAAHVNHFPTALVQFQFKGCYQHSPGVLFDLSLLPDTVAVLDIEGNHFTGEFDAARLPRDLDQLRISNNNFTGNLALEQCTKLTLMFAADNQFTSLSAPWPSQLNHVDLSNNQLSGPVLEAWLAPPKLASLWLTGNRFTSMPPLSAIPNSLQDFRLDRNQLTGNPFAVPMLPSSSLMELRLEGNLLSGPVNLTGLSSAVQRVYLAENKFDALVEVARIPPSISQLELRNNSINGTINFNSLPTALKKRTWSLDLRNNLITGNLAFDPGFSSTATIVLAGNPFACPLPPESEVYPPVGDYYLLSCTVQPSPAPTTPPTLSPSSTPTHSQPIPPVTATATATATTRPQPTATLTLTVTKQPPATATATTTATATVSPPAPATITSAPAPAPSPQPVKERTATPLAVPVPPDSPIPTTVPPVPVPPVPQPTNNQSSVGGGGSAAVPAGGPGWLLPVVGGAAVVTTLTLCACCVGIHLQVPCLLALLGMAPRPRRKPRTNELAEPLVECTSSSGKPARFEMLVEPLNYQGALPMFPKPAVGLSALLLEKEVSVGVTGMYSILARCEGFARHNPLPKTVRLTKDERLALLLYTFDWAEEAPREANFYYALNRCLRQRDPLQLAAWSGYLYHLFHALDALPTFTGKAYRGQADAELASQEYRQGRCVCWSAFSSCSEDPQVARGFAGPAGVVFEVSVSQGSRIAEVSFLQGEGEVLLRPNAALVVTRAAHLREDGLWVELTEVEKGSNVLVQ